MFCSVCGNKIIFLDTNIPDTCTGLFIIDTCKHTKQQQNKTSKI